MVGVPPTAIRMYLAVYCFPSTSTVCGSISLPRPSMVCARSQFVSFFYFSVRLQPDM